MEDVKVIVNYELDENCDLVKQYLIERIEELQMDYRRQIKPYIERLAELENLRVPKYSIVTTIG